MRDATKEAIIDEVVNHPFAARVQELVEGATPEDVRSASEFLANAMQATDSPGQLMGVFASLTPAARELARMMLDATIQQVKQIAMVVHSIA